MKTVSIQYQAKKNSPVETQEFKIILEGDETFFNAYKAGERHNRAFADFQKFVNDVNNLNCRALRFVPLSSNHKDFPENSRKGNKGYGRDENPEFFEIRGKALGEIEGYIWSTWDGGEPKEYKIGFHNRIYERPLTDAQEKTLVGWFEAGLLPSKDDKALLDELKHKAIVAAHRNVMQEISEAENRLKETKDQFQQFWVDYPNDGE